ncbi:MAG: hypothetical protein U7123_21180 [Potamolinea sp.]
MVIIPYIMANAWCIRGYSMQQLFLLERHPVPVTGFFLPFPITVAEFDTVVIN